MKSISKLFLAFAILFACQQTTFSQTKGQLTCLQELGEGSVFKQYYGITKNGDTYSGEAAQQCELKFINNINNKLSAFQLNKEGKDEVLINCGFGFLKPNHYTEPSLFHSKTHSMAYVYINGLLYCIKKVSDPLTVQNIEFEKIYVLIKPAKGEHTSGKAALKELKNRNHEEAIKQYLNEMKAIQEKATANFTDEIKAEIDAVENKASADKAANKAKNDAYWASPEGQKKLGEMRKADVILTNDTGMELGLCHGQGVSTVLKPGEKKSFSCHGGKVYVGIKDGNSVNLKRTDKLLLDLSGNNCGSNYNASSLLK